LLLQSTPGIGATVRAHQWTRGTSNNGHRGTPAFGGG
jgi:hypothetical protein